MRVLKYHPHGSVLFITLSIEEGLLLLCNPLCKAIIRSCLAKAQNMYPLIICHFIVEATHVHLLAVVNNPDDVKDFVRYFKTESAHLLNNVLGRRKRTIWCEGYDSPVVLSPLRALMVVSYLYANAAKDNLETSIEKYPGLSSWKMYRHSSYTRDWKGFRRPELKALAPDRHNLSGYTREAERLLRASSNFYRFAIEPDAWLGAFGIIDPAQQARWNDRLVRRVRALEERAHRKRAATGKSVMGSSRLLRQSLNTTYRPNRSGRRMWCLSENRKLRMSFIDFMKELRAKAREVRAKWFSGDFSSPFPLGLYPPSMPKLAEPLAVW